MSAPTPILFRFVVKMPFDLGERHYMCGNVIEFNLRDEALAGRLLAEGKIAPSPKVAKP